MAASLPIYTFTPQSDWRWTVSFKEMDGSPVSLLGRVFKAYVTPAGLDAPAFTLSPVLSASGDDGSTIVDTMTFKLSKAQATGGTLPLGVVAADIYEFEGSESFPFLPVKIDYVHASTVRRASGAGSEVRFAKDVRVVTDRGARGASGPVNVLSIGSVTTASAASDAQVVLSGTSPNQQISFVIPRGANGPANIIAIGTVSASAPGSPAQASMSGSSPNQALNLVLPRGDPGSKGDKGDRGDSGATTVDSISDAGTAGRAIAKAADAAAVLTYLGVDLAAKANRSIVHSQRDTLDACPEGFSTCDATNGPAGAFNAGYQVITQTRPNNPAFGWQLAVADTVDGCPLFFRMKYLGTYKPWARHGTTCFEKQGGRI